MIELIIRLEQNNIINEVIDLAKSLANNEANIITTEQGYNAIGDIVLRMSVTIEDGNISISIDNASSYSDATYKLLLEWQLNLYSALLAAI